jgi:hypothetical protein
MKKRLFVFFIIGILLISVFPLINSEEGESSSSDSSDSSETSQSNSDEVSSSDESSQDSGDSEKNEMSPEEIERIKEELIAKAEEMKEEIEKECKKDPVACSCEIIPCSDILEAEHERKQEVYDRCIEEKKKCEEQRQEGIKEMEKEKTQISQECRKDLKKCDCSQITSEEGKEECELAIIEAQYLAEKEKQDKIKECLIDLDSCDCNSISDSQGKEECIQELEIGRKLKDKIKNACEKDIVNCDCSEIKISEAKKECEDNKNQALGEIDNAIKGALSKCFKNVDECDCSDLGLQEFEKKSNVEEGVYVSFCEIQKEYGLSCKKEGKYCDKLDDVEIYPVGMPPWLGKFFANSYSDYIEKEKEKGAREAGEIITSCINNPETCDCSKTPSYAESFCEKMKKLQLKCYADDYNACLILEESPNLPEGMPEFTISGLNRMIEGLREARKKSSQGSAAKKVGDMILECMDDSKKCDCSFSPKGEIKAFCEHKKDLVKSCRDKKNYDSCFKLDEEPIFTENMPQVIKDYLEKNMLPKIEIKKQEIFDEMKIGTSCESLSTIKDCKEFLKK